MESNSKLYLLVLYIGFLAPFLLRGLTWAMLYVWTKNYPQVVGTCSGNHGQLISQNCVLTKIRAEPPPLNITRLVFTGCDMYNLSYMYKLYYTYELRFMILCIYVWLNDCDIFDTTINECDSMRYFLILFKINFELKLYLHYTIHKLWNKTQGYEKRALRFGQHLKFKIQITSIQTTNIQIKSPIIITFN